MKAPSYTFGDAVRVKDGIYEGDTFTVTPDNTSVSTGRVRIPRYYHKGCWFYETDLEPVYYYHLLQFAREAYAMYYYFDVILPDGLPATRWQHRESTVVLISTHMLSNEERQQIEETLAFIEDHTTNIAWNSLAP